MFRFSAAELGNTDIVKGGAGSDQLRLTSAGTVDANGVGGVETYVLFNGAGNVLTLDNASFTGVANSTITVEGGDAGNTLSETGVSAADHAALKGGAGNDTLVAGRNAVLTGGAGKDVFELTVAGSPAAPVSVTIADFGHGTDELALSEKGFNLGSTPDAATLFAANKGGSFTSPNQRFAYDTAGGDLFYDGRGNAAGSTRLETRHPDQPRHADRERHHLCRVSGRREARCDPGPHPSLSPAGGERRFWARGVGPAKADVDRGWLARCPALCAAPAGCVALAGAPPVER